MNENDFAAAHRRYWLAVEAACVAVCHQYAKSAPCVEAWADMLVANRNTINPAELDLLASLKDGDGWVHPYYAQNRLYHLLHRLGRDTSGMSDY